MQALCVVANFVEVWLAREGHANPVGINVLEKIQAPHLPSIYGAMLAGVSYVLMGAGIPQRIPGVLDRFANHEPATYPLHVSGASGDETVTLTRRANGRVDGFIVEGPTVGGHNAPPRGALRLNDRGEPVYGPRDVVNLGEAAGVQVGTGFAVCSESGLRDDLRNTLQDQVRAGRTDIVTHAKASPTGFPFKVATVPGTLSDPAVMAARPRICDLGYLREAYRDDDGAIGFRCPSDR